MKENKKRYYNISFNFADDLEANHTLQYIGKEIENRYPWMAHVINNPEFQSISWVIDLTEVAIKIAE